MLARIFWVFAPLAVGFPPHVLRAITAGRIARSAALFISGPSCTHRAIWSKGSGDPPFPSLEGARNFP